MYDLLLCLLRLALRIFFSFGTSCCTELVFHLHLIHLAELFEVLYCSRVPTPSPWVTSLGTVSRNCAGPPFSLPSGGVRFSHQGSPPERLLGEPQRWSFWSGEKPDRVDLSAEERGGVRTPSALSCPYPCACCSSCPSWSSGKDVIEDISTPGRDELDEPLSDLSSPPNPRGESCRRDNADSAGAATCRRSLLATTLAESVEIVSLRRGKSQLEHVQRVVPPGRRLYCTVCNYKHCYVRVECVPSALPRKRAGSVPFEHTVLVLVLYSPCTIRNSPGKLHVSHSRPGLASARIASGQSTSSHSSRPIVPLAGDPTGWPQDV
jgi:hypothetical protein